MNNERGIVRCTYTAEQIAVILGVSLRKVYDLCENTTDFKVIRLGRRCVRIHKESFDRWLDDLTQPKGTAKWQASRPETTPIA